MDLELTASAETGAEVVHQLRARANHLKHEDHDPQIAAITDAAIAHVASKIGDSTAPSFARVTLVVQCETSRAPRRGKPSVAKRAQAIAAELPPEPAPGPETFDFPPKHVPDLRLSSVREDLEKELAGLESEGESDPDATAEREGRIDVVKAQLAALAAGEDHTGPTPAGELAPIGG